MDDNGPRTPRTPGRSRANSQNQSQEEPGSDRQRKINNALAAGLKQPREMGMREMDQVGGTMIASITILQSLIEC